MPALNHPAGRKQPGHGPGHWVCFSCRKMFRNFAQNCVCPQCAEPMIEMGTYFEPPKKSNRGMWEMMKTLAENGYRFRTEGSRAFVFGQWAEGRRPSMRTVKIRISKMVDAE